MPLHLLKDINLYKSFFEHSITHKWVRDLEGRYLLVNQSYADSLSLKKEEIIGKTNFELMPHDLAEKFAEDDQIVVKEGYTFIREVNYFFRNKEVTFLVWKFPLYDEEGNILAIGGSATDMSNERIFSQHLKQKENLLSSIIESMGDGLLFFNTEGHLEFANPAAESILKPIISLPLTQKTLTHLQLFLLRKQKEGKHLSNKAFPWSCLIKSSEIRDQEFGVASSKDSKLIQINASKLVVKDHDNENLGTIVTFTDITEKNRLFEKVQQQSKELTSKNETLEQFVHFISHDLQEPLRTINSFIDILKMELKKENNPSVSNYMHIIKEAGKRMNSMIRELREFCEVEGHASFKRVDLNICLKKALNLLEGYLNETQASIHCVPLPSVRGNEASLILLFQNLISNAIKFQSSSPPEVFVTLEEEEDSYVIGIKDKGIGIEPRFSKHIFLPFKRIVSKAHYSGSGIGLALCKKVMDKHHGEIWVESKKGEGAHFKFKLKKILPITKALPQEKKIAI